MPCASFRQWHMYMCTRAYVHVSVYPSLRRAAGRRHAAVSATGASPWARATLNHLCTYACAHVCICACVHMHTYTYAHICICTRMHMCACMHIVCTCARVHACIMCTHAYVHVCTWMCVLGLAPCSTTLDHLTLSRYAYVYVHLTLSICICVYVYVYMYMCICICLCAPDTLAVAVTAAELPKRGAGTPRRPCLSRRPTLCIHIHIHTEH